MFSSLSARLFVLIALVTLAGESVLGWLVVEMHTADLERETVQSALHLSDILERSMRNSMLQNRKEDVYGMIRAIGEQPGIERFRIYNSDGEITFSTLAGERGHIADTNAEACTRCHHGVEPVSRLKGQELTRIFRDPGGNRVLGLITPVYNEASCAGGACHPSPEDQQVLGVLDVQLSLAGIDATVAEQNRRFLLVVYLLMFVIAGICGLFVWRFVHVPVKELIRGTERIRQGYLSHRLAVGSRTEIGRLAASFNAMAEDLGRAQEELKAWARTLEKRVEEKTRILQQAQARLIQNEKMASLGTLSAVVAHEVNNPLSGVLTYTKLVRRLVGEDGPAPDKVPAIQRHLKTMEEETARCGKIVQNLLEFSRQSGVESLEVDVNEILERTLFLIGHKVELQGIELSRDLSADLPPVSGDADQIQQALLAVLINAIEAMPQGGQLEVVSRVKTDDTEGRRAVVEVRDTGPGIPEEVMPRIFDPFFTTKQSQKGVGLGLSVVYGIVTRHHGTIEAQSRPGRTVFTVSLPGARGRSGSGVAGRTTVAEEDGRA
ncbi:MAG: ATP-binding protein [Gemmatimonadota bacterium]